MTRLKNVGGREKPAKRNKNKDFFVALLMGVAVVVNSVVTEYPYIKYVLCNSTNRCDCTNFSISLLDKKLYSFPSDSRIFFGLEVTENIKSHNKIVFDIAAATLAAAIFR